MKLDVCGCVCVSMGVNVLRLCALHVMCARVVICVVCVMVCVCDVGVFVCVALSVCI